jgi:hypothetical protein
MAMQKHLDDPNRLVISDELWNEVEREQKESGYDKEEEVGYDRETYTYALMQGHKSAIATTLRHEGRKLNNGPRYLLELEGSLDTPEAVQEIAILSAPPAIVSGGESGDFVLLDTEACETIAAHLAPSEGTFFAYRTPAAKALSGTSIAPTLGIDATLPHRRALPKPLQDEYPVSYFFYGTLADPETLYQKLDLEGMPTPMPAVVRGGKIKVWSGKYRALVDAGESDEVVGSMYVVQSKAHEDKLRVYEGGNYEVVRCMIEVETGEAVYGLTLRYCGDVGTLADE